MAGWSQSCRGQCSDNLSMFSAASGWPVDIFSLVCTMIFKHLNELPTDLRVERFAASLEKREELALGSCSPVAFCWTVLVPPPSLCLSVAWKSRSAYCPVCICALALGRGAEASPPPLSPPRSLLVPPSLSNLHGPPWADGSAGDGRWALEPVLSWLRPSPTVRFGHNTLLLRASSVECH